ncbi:putative dehydrogenase [Lipingzhangella halophila]|uniref:Putative dehydrogenase n=1 Tax=Lipingzhangella halophila TaxID=1783352 RepID=A0A7W7W1S0_9ACTN|nr:Gfo/Idh/MocA family oxidoreductase [Lipingzhangella halophila]MBB4930044.1 putative dehydrogenase [Lipingzhangella halophila]
MSSANEGERELHVALLGYGMGGEVFHAPLIDATPGMRLSAVVTGNAERAAAARKRYPHVEVLGSADEVWRRPGDFEVAVIATPNDLHAPFASAAMKAGMAVVVDKPFALSPAQARELAGEAEQRDQVLTAFHNRRWDSDFLTLWKLVDEGALGRVHRFESRFERWRPAVKDIWREWGSEAAGAGILYDLGPHLIDQAITVLGPVASVYPEIDTRREGSATDDVFLALTHESGARSHLWMSALAGHPGPRFRVLGDRGAYTVDGLDGQQARLADGERPDAGDWGVEPETAWGHVRAGDDARAVPSARGDYPAFYSGVRDAVAEGEPAPVDLHEVVHGLEVIEAARRGAATGQVASVERD